MQCIILLILLLSFISASPQLKSEILPDGAYITRERTCMINGFFIWFVFISHMSGYFPNNNYIPQYDYLVNKCLRLLAQCVVATFFFYSGFGLMSSMQTRKNYARSLIYKRLPKLYLYFSIAITLYLGVQAYYGTFFSLTHTLQAYVAWKSVGNSTWFICITLISYPIIALCNTFFHQKGKIAVASSATALFLGLVYIMYLIWDTESHWYNTSLCIPAGMWFYIYRNKMEILIKYTHMPAWISGCLLIPLSIIIYRLLSPYPYLLNIAAIMFALGITLVFSCISLKKHPSFLCWSGGAGLFFIYIYQRIPMLVGAKMGWTSENPFVFQFFCLSVTLLIAWVCSKLLPKLTQHLYY